MPDAAPPPPTTSPVIAFFDVDNTLLRGASIYHLGRGAHRRGVLGFRELLRFGWHQLHFVTRGERIGHLTGVRERALQLIRGHSEHELADIAAEVYDDFIAPKLWPETVQLTREHLEKGHEVWLITATPLAVAVVIAERLGLTGALGTELESHGGNFTGRLLGPLLHGPHKVVKAIDLANRLGADLSGCWAYSDSRNDLPLLELVGHRVVVNPDRALALHARIAGWEVLELRRSSIRRAARRVRFSARRTARTV